MLVDNAGVRIVEPAEATEWSRGEALLRLDLHTPLRLTQLALPEMLAWGAGAIVNALASPSEALRGEVRPRGVRVITGPAIRACSRRWSRAQSSAATRA